VAPRIIFGVNLNFAKFVYGPRRALEIVRDRLELRHVEMVPDIDFGPVFYTTAPEAFRSHHWGVADRARELGVSIESVLTFYRDTGSIAHTDPAIRESVYRVGLSILEQAACYRARFASAELFSIPREVAEDPELFQSLYDVSLEIWKRWMNDARRLGLEGMLIETAAAYREGCSTIEDTRATLAIFDRFHRENPGSTVPVHLCYDTGHGISEEESEDPKDRDFRAWFDAFSDRIREIHLKNTDPEFQETFHFGEGSGGIIDPREVVAAIRDRLSVPRVLLFLEVPGKRGREIGEKRALEGHRRSIAMVREALCAAGYREDPADGSWGADGSCGR
jgi:sugar phosphate isomerase/epimerase